MWSVLTVCVVGQRRHLARLVLIVIVVAGIA